MDERNYKKVKQPIKNQQGAFDQKKATYGNDKRPPRGTGNSTRHPGNMSGQRPVHNQSKRRHDEAKNNDFGDFIHSLKGKMTPRTTIFLAVGAVAVVFVLCMLINIFIGVRTVVVVGNNLASAEEIMSVAGIEHGSGYFSYNTGKSEKKVMSEIHCISDIKISRSVFGKVKVTVTEKKACWYIEVYGEYYALSDTLEAIRCTEIRDDFIKRGLIRLDFPQIVSVVLGKTVEYSDEDRDCSYIPQFLEDVKSTQMYADKRINQINIETKFEIFAVCDLKYKIHLGKYSGVVMKLSSVEKALAESMFSENYTFEIDASDVGNITARVEENLDFSFLKPVYGD